MCGRTRSELCVAEADGSDYGCGGDDCLWGYVALIGAHDVGEREKGEMNNKQLLSRIGDVTWLCHTILVVGHVHNTIQHVLHLSQQLIRGGPLSLGLTKTMMRLIALTRFVAPTRTDTYFPLVLCQARPKTINGCLFALAQ